jgi:predicted MFS family arabinose efflux permease
VVQEAGYSAAFLTLAGVAMAALVLLWVAVPETVSRSGVEPTGLQTPVPPIVAP